MEITRRTLLTHGAAAAVLAAGCRTTASPTATFGSTGDPTTTTTAGATFATPAPPVPPTTAPPTTVPPAWSGADFGRLDDFIDTTNGESLLIMEQGQVVHEWHRTDAGYRRDIASAQKSILSLIVGRAVGDGLISLDTPIDEVLGRSWTDHGQTAGITVRHLLTMTSGLDNQYEVVATPGEVWVYSNAFSSLFDVVTTVTGRALNDVATEWLFEPVGATDAIFYNRRSEQYAPIGLFTSARTLAAVGEGMRLGTIPGLPADWLTASFAPTEPQNPAYGLLWWLNGQSGFLLPGPATEPQPGSFISSAPDDLVAALGKDDQKLYFVPSLDLVVTRLGGKAVPGTVLAKSPFDNDLWALLMELRG